MRRLLPTLLVGLALAWPLAPHGPAAPEGALLTRIELERGRALFVDDTGVVPLERHAGPRSHTGPGHFELAPGSTAVVRWAGRGSVRVEGPTSLSWDELTAEDELRLRFGTVAEADLELRRGGARVDLPGAWRLELGPGAVNLRSLPVGGVELVHHAGVAARASWIGGPGVSAPRWIGPGQRARLAGTPEPSRTPDVTAAASAWPVASWPWGAGGVPDRPEAGRAGAAAWADPSWPWGPPQLEAQPWERWDWPWQPQPAVEPELETGADPAVEPAVAPAPGDDAPEADGGFEDEDGHFEDEYQPLLVPSAAPEDVDVLDPPISWPWGEVPEPPPASESAESAAPAVEATLPVEPEIAPEPEVVTEPEIAPEPEVVTEPEIVSEPQPEPHATPEPEVVPPPAAAPEPEVAPEPPPFPAYQWRGLAREQLVPLGDFVVQASGAWQREELEGGLVRLSLPVDAGEPAWLFGAEYDYRAFPGASLLVEPDGTVRSHEGWVRVLLRTPGRAPLARP